MESDKNIFVTREGGPIYPLLIGLKLHLLFYRSSSRIAYTFDEQNSKCYSKVVFP